MFILFISKWSQVKNFKEIKNRVTKNAITSSSNPQFFNINRPKQSNFLAQITIPVETTFSNIKFILEFDTEIEGNKEEEIIDSKFLSALLALESKIIN